MVVVTDLGPPEEGVRHKQENTAVFINRRQLGMGTLYISEARVSWVSIQGKGFSLEYPHIAMHAVSRDLTQFHSEHLYLMIDVRLLDSDGTPMSTPASSNAGSGDDSDNEESDGGMTEIRFIPDDRASLDRMFQAMTECQALHPDDDVESDEDEPAGDDEEQVEEGMFDDADDDKEPGGQNGHGGKHQEEAMDAD